MRGLHPELAAYLEEGGMFGVTLLRHPLVYAVPFFDTGSEVRRLNTMLEEKQNQCERARAEHDHAAYIFLHERPYRIGAFMELRDEMYDRNYWPLLREVWTDSENIYQHAMDWWECLSSDRRKRRLFTSCEDRAILRSMPNELRIYRGTSQEETLGTYLGFSWTTDRDKALWFARRFNREGVAPTLASGYIKKCDALGYVNARGEKEVVALPRDITGLEWEEV